MKAMLAAFAATALITVAAWFTLTDVLDFTSADQGASERAVRLGDAAPEDRDAVLSE